MSLLKDLTSSSQLKTFSAAQLKQLCNELRETIIGTVSKTGGHLASNLGVVELTVALHRVFSLPKDRIVWDVGHQCYAHKLLTGRLPQFDTLRQTGGISGFPKPSESEYDTFVAGHSSTSVSAADGIATAQKLVGNDGYVIAVIGDGAMTGGLAYEGLSNAGQHDGRLIVILNDNKMSINQNVGFMARHLTSLRSGTLYLRVKRNLRRMLSHFPAVGEPIYRLIASAKTRLKRHFYRASDMFEEMGFHYMGPVDGHDLKDLQRTMNAAKQANRPAFIHVITVKGYGYEHAEHKPEMFHGISAFEVETGQTAKSSMTYSKAVGHYLCETAKKDERLCVVTAAMTDGTGLSTFSRQYPDRFFDVGIAEEHAMTFLSGLSVGGCLPVFAVYSTFLQRAYDQILNDTSIMNNHVVLAIDRAGIVPDDGETHQGIYDVPFLSTIPHTTIYAPSTYEELTLHMERALYKDEGIVAVRYPRGSAFPMTTMYTPEDKPFVHYRNDRARILIVTYGRLFANAVDTVSTLKDELPLSVLKLNRIHPIPSEVVAIASQYRRVIFFEESAKNGGIGQQLASALMERHYRGDYEIHAIDTVIPNCSVADALSALGLDTEGMIRTVRGGEDRG